MNAVGPGANGEGEGEWESGGRERGGYITLTGCVRFAQPSTFIFDPLFFQ